MNNAAWYRNVYNGNNINYLFFLLGIIVVECLIL